MKEGLGFMRLFTDGKRKRLVRVLCSFAMAGVLLVTNLPPATVWADPTDPTDPSASSDPSDPGTASSADPTDPVSDPADPDIILFSSASGAAEHVHNWSYKAEEDTIYAWCGAGETEEDRCAYYGTAEAHLSAVTLTVQAENAAYNGLGHGVSLVKSVPNLEEPWTGVSVQYSGTTVGNASYNSAEAPVAAGSYTVGVSATASDDSVVSVSKSFTITPADLSAATLSITNPSYTGGTVSPTVLVSVPGISEALAEGTDYTISGNQEIEPGAYILTIVGAGNYTGTAEAAWLIMSSAAAVTEAPAAATGLTYNGAMQPLLSSPGTANGGTMYYSLDGVNYDVAIPVGKNAGDYTVFYKAVGGDGYTDSAVESLTASIGKCPVTVSNIIAEDKKYDGNTNAELVCKKATFTPLYGGDTLTVSAIGSFRDVNAGTEKDVDISDLQLGGASVNNYELAAAGQQASATAAIKKKPLSDSMLSLENNTFAWDGEEKSPVLTVEDDGTQLTVGEDYTINDSNACKASAYGEYTITISGSNNYEGSASIDWRIVDNTPPSVTISISKYENPFTTFINNITFNLFFKEKKEVTITAADGGSGVAHVYYILSEVVYTKEKLKELDDSKWTEYEAPFVLNDKDKLIVYAKAVDNASQATCVSSNGMVFDLSSPTIQLNGEKPGTDMPCYYEPVEIVVTDTNLESVRLDITTEDLDKKIKKTDDPADGYTETVSEVGAYTVTAADQAGNVLEQSFQIARADAGIEAVDQTYTYVRGETYDVSQLFHVQSGGEASYEVVSGGSGDGILDGERLTIKRAGTIKIRITTAQLPYVKSGAEVAELTVEKAEGEVTLVYPDMTYGIVPTTTIESTTNPGLYEILYQPAGGGAAQTDVPRDAGKYNVTVTFPENELYLAATASTTFEIRKAALSVAAKNVTKTYGEQDPVFDYTVSGLQWKDTAGGVLTGALERTAGEDTGTYAIKQGSLSASGNYEMSFAGAELTITKATHGNVVVPAVKIPSGGFQDREVDLAAWLETEPELRSAEVRGDITGSIELANALKGTTYTYSMTESAAGKTGSILLTVGSRNYEEYTISLPLEVEKKVTTVVEGKTDAVVTAVNEVNGLSDYTKTQGGSASVEVTMRVQTEEESEVVPDSAVPMIRERVASSFPGISENEINREYLDISVEQATIRNGTTETKEISDVKRVLEISLTVNIPDKRSPVVFREHEGSVKQFTRLSARPTSGYRDGTYYLSGSNLYIYGRWFSTYAIAYTASDSSMVTLDYYAGASTQLVVLDGSTIADPGDPHRAGFTFLGWYNGNEPWDFATPISADTVLKAAYRWNGGGGGGEAPGDMEESAAPLSGVIAAVYQVNDPARLALNDGISGGTKTLAARAPKTGDMLLPIWLLAVLFAAGGSLTLISGISMLFFRRREACEDLKR